VPIGLKDIFVHARGSRPPAGSKILRGFVPPYESTVSGAPGCGRRGRPGQAEHGRVRHGLVEREQRLQADAQSLVDLEHVPGGSSGGSAAAVAASLCAGSDWAPTPAARFVSRLRSAAWSG
jgi:aspartyl-tRNA(Asn)/glutamyl-tRNA(Gln) amidotransferase subunit A